MLVAARLLAGISQADLARLAGVDQSALSRFERGGTVMRTDKLNRVIEALKTSGVQFLGPTDEWDGGIVVTSGRSDEMTGPADAGTPTPRGVAGGPAPSRRVRRRTGSAVPGGAGS